MSLLEMHCQWKTYLHQHPTKVHDIVTQAHFVIALKVIEKY